MYNSNFILKIYNVSLIYISKILFTNFIKTVKFKHLFHLTR